LRQALRVTRRCSRHLVIRAPPQGDPHRRARSTRRSRLLRPRTPHVRGHPRSRRSKQPSERSSG
jgi:hypothetical protein